VHLPKKVNVTLVLGFKGPTRRPNLHITHRSGFKVGRLPRIGFVPDSDDQAFGFLDPSLVIRGCHLIPAFVQGKTTELLKANVTAARPVGEIDDWTAFYVNM
jgi:hypothetical protein